jgi:hypothetical protein
VRLNYPNRLEGRSSRHPEMPNVVSRLRFGTGANFSFTPMKKAEFISGNSYKNDLTCLFF